MSSSPDVPTPADPTKTANSQFDLNKKAGTLSQQGSMVNQVGPQGSLTYNQTGTSPDGTPLYTATTALSPENQKLLDILQGTKTSAATQGQGVIANAGYGNGNIGDIIGNATSGLTKDAMDKQVAYLDPFFKQQTDQLDTKLKNQGFAPGQPGYDTAMNALRQSHGQTVTGFESTMEPQMWQQAVSNYMLPAQLGGTLANFGAPGTFTPTNTPSLNVQSPDLIGATNSAYQQQMQAYNAQMAQNNNMMSGLFGIPTAVLGGWAQSGGLSSALPAAAAFL